MGQDALIKALTDETKREVAHILEEAEAEAEELLDSARNEVKRAALARVGSIRIELDKKLVALANRARSGARGALLTVRAEAVEAVLGRATEDAATMKGGEYKGVLDRFYEELRGSWSEDMNSAAPRVHVNPADKTLVASLVKDGEEVVADETVSIGVVFVSPDGTVRAENSFAARLEKLRDLLRKEVDRRLFE